MRSGLRWRLAVMGAAALVALTPGCGEDGGEDGGGTADGGGDTTADDTTGDDTGADDTPPPDGAHVAEDGALVFPAGFVFGTAIAGFQADMGCPTWSAAECDDPHSDWYAFITSPETVQSGGAYLSGDPPSYGPGFWELYEDDLDRVAGDLANTGFRFSLEWSRIFPEATDGLEGYDALAAVADAGAVARYHEILDALAERGVAPLVTLNHYTLPTWIHDGVGCHLDLDGCSPRGWLDRERTVTEAARYAGFVAEEFGHQIDRWATLNEPFAVMLPGYILPSEERSNPPAVSLRTAEAKEVFVAMIEGHARMYDAVKAADLADADGDGVASEVGIVYAMAPVKPMDPESELDVASVGNIEYLWNFAFLDAVVAGVLDADLDGVGEARDDLADRMDYLGINYYTPVIIEGTEDPVLEDLSPLTTFNPLTFITWQDYPRGIYEVVLAATERYDGIPIVITENGLPLDLEDEDGGSDFLVRHLTWLWRAARDGADVRGYYFWTLVDNYEWNHGMGLRFGLYGIDPDDPAKTRTARHHVATYGAIAGSGSLPVEQLEAYPALEGGDAE